MPLCPVGAQLQFTLGLKSRPLFHIRYVQEEALRKEEGHRWGFRVRPIMQNQHQRQMSVLSWTFEVKASKTESLKHEASDRQVGVTMQLSGHIELNLEEKNRT